MPHKTNCFAKRACWVCCAVVVLALLGTASAVRADLIFDVRGTSVTGTGVSLSVDGKTVTATAAATSGSVTFDVWAMVTGTNGNPNDESIQLLFGGFTSYQVGGGRVLGNATTGMSTATLSAPFNQTASSPGGFIVGGAAQPAGSIYVYKYDGDTDRDLGGSGVTLAGWTAFVSDSNVSLASPNGAVVNPLAGGFEAKLGTITYSWSSYLAGGGITALNWVARNAATYSFGIDGAAGTNPQISRSKPIVVLAPGQTFDDSQILIDSGAQNPGTGASSATVNVGNVLVHAQGIASSALLNNAGGDNTVYTVSSSSAGLWVASNGTIGANSVQSESVSLKLLDSAAGTGTYGNKTYAVNVHNTASGSSSAGHGSQDTDDTINVNVNVGLAQTGGNHLFGPALTAVVGAGSLYPDLASKTTPGIEAGPTPTAVVGTEAIILSGSNTTGPAETVSMSWRTRTVGEIIGGVRLVSDVVELSGIDYTGPNDNNTPRGRRTDEYRLQLSYDETALPGGGAEEAMQAALGHIFLAWFNPTTHVWENAVEGNFISPPLFGVDTDANIVWAVLDHDGHFAVVPEPASAVLMCLGALGILAIRRRRRGHGA